MKTLLSENTNNNSGILLEVTYRMSDINSEIMPIGFYIITSFKPYRSHRCTGLYTITNLSTYNNYMISDVSYKAEIKRKRIIAYDQ